MNRDFESHSDEPVNDLAHAGARSSRGFELRSSEPARDVAPPGATSLRFAGLEKIAQRFLQ